MIPAIEQAHRSRFDRSKRHARGYQDYQRSRGDGAIAAPTAAGFDMDIIQTASLGLTYQGQLDSEAQEHGFKAKLAVRF